MNHTKRSAIASQVAPEHFRLVAEATYDWEAWHNPEGQVMWINSAVERITGYTAEQCLSMPRYPMPLVFEGDVARVAEIFASFSNRTTGNDIEFRIRHSDQRIAFVAISWQPMYAQDGAHLGCRTSIRDISERQELRAQITRYNEHLEQLVQEKTDRLRQLERRRAQLEKLAALGQLAAGVAHEINNPLAGIRNAFLLIRSDVPRKAASFPLLDLVDKEIERLASMVRNMFQAFRRDTEEAKPFELQLVLSQVIQMLSSTATGRGVSLVQTTEESIDVCLPEGEVKQVLYNLGRNAIQACSTGNTVQFAARIDHDKVILSVEDNGAGIASENLPFIFEPYFSTKGGVADPSMGLGLSICKRLVETMGGEIEVVTTAGQGSQFLVTLPKKGNAVANRDTQSHPQSDTADEDVD